MQLALGVIAIPPWGLGTALGGPNLGKNGSTSASMTAMPAMNASSDPRV
jgi:hypothetical protein